MSLRDLAAADHAAIVGDLAGFGWPVQVVNPEGLTATTTCLTSDVGEVVDPQTGMPVLARRVTVQVLPGPLKAAGMGDVRVVADSNSKPWRMRFADTHGVVRTYKVMAVMPDSVLGSLRCELEAYAVG